MIPFNKPYLHGRELVYIADSVASGKISGDGRYTKKCHEFFERKYGFQKVLLTTSCTDALEMAAILLDIKEGDEVIVPSFTFVSTANAFALRGAKIVFADSGVNNPNISSLEIERLISKNTKAIVVVHYAGVACDMDSIMMIANNHGIPVVEDAAQAIDSFYKNRPLGSFGTFGTFSFHETKNIISGEGGMLVINDPKYNLRAEIIREKGTNRSSFFRGEVDKYGWVDIGSSFLPSDIISAFLYAQLEVIEQIQTRRKEIWNCYHEGLSVVASLGFIRLPIIPADTTNNAHMFYFLCNDLSERTKLIEYLKSKNIMAVFHYLPLHSSPYYSDFYDGIDLPYADQYAENLIRLPLYFELSRSEIKLIIDAISEYFMDKA